MGNIASNCGTYCHEAKDLCHTGNSSSLLNFECNKKNEEECNYTLAENNLVVVSSKDTNKAFHQTPTYNTAMKPKLYVFTFKSNCKQNEYEEFLLNLQDHKAQSTENLSYKLENLKKINRPRTNLPIESATNMIYAKLSNSNLNGFRKINEVSSKAISEEGVLEEQDEAQHLLNKREISQGDFLFLLKCLSNIFPNYSEEEQKEILNCLINYEVSPDTLITKHSDSINCIYIIKTGKVGLYRKFKLTEVFNDGDSFGDFTLLKIDQAVKLNSWAGCEYRSIVKTELYMVSSQEINWIHSEYTRKKYEEILVTLNQIPLLKFLDIRTKKLFSENLVKVTVRQGMKLMLSPNRSDSVLFIEEGVLVRESENEPVSYFKAGDTINYEFLLKPGTQRYTVSVYSITAIVVIITKDSLINLMGDDFRSKLIFLCFYSAIEANKPLFQILSHFNKHNSEMGSVKQNSENTSSLIASTQNESKKNNTAYRQANSNIQKNGSFLDINSSIYKNNKDSLHSNNSFKQSCAISKSEDFRYLMRKFNLRNVEAGQSLQLNEDTCIILIHGAIEETISSKLIHPLKVISTIADFKDEDKVSKHCDYVFAQPSYVLRGELHSILKYEDKENKNTLIHYFLDISRWMYLLPEDTLLSLGSYIERIKYPSRATIKERNKVSDSLIFLKHGNIIKRTWNQKDKDPSIVVVPEGTIIGEKELFLPDSGFDEELEISELIQGSSAVVFQLRAKFIKIFISKNLHKYIKEEIFGKANKIQFDLGRAELISYIGCGAFGFVNLIRHNRKLYALKSIKKEQLNYQSSVTKYLGFEKESLSLIHSPFVLSLEQSLIDNQYYHFITEYIQGIGLEKVIESKGTKLNADACLFYTANLVVILELLKKKSIVHRDIKPSNMMVQANGYLKLIDFGVSKQVKDFTYTVVGSPYFIAPEILEGQGYSFSCDYWSVGITLYNMYFKHFPFGENSNTVMDVYKEICEGAISFPSGNQKKNPQNDQVENLIKLLLRKSSKRPCSIKELTNYISFIDWSEIMTMNLEPPFLPELEFSDFIYYNEEDNNSKLNKSFRLHDSKGVCFNNKIISTLSDNNRKR